MTVFDVNDLWTFSGCVYRLLFNEPFNYGWNRVFFAFYRRLLIVAVFLKDLFTLVL